MDDYQFEKLPSTAGFYNTGVNEIVEDQYGLLWFATWSGLARFDGYKIKMYRQLPDHSNGLKSNKITTIFQSSNNNLWVGTNYTGFYKYDRAQDKFIQYHKKNDDLNSLSNNNVYAIFEDSKGILWIGTENGLNRFDPETETFKHYFHSESDKRSLSHSFVYSISESPDSTIWIGTERGLNRLVESKDGDYFQYYDLLKDNSQIELSLSHNFIFNIVPSIYDDHTIWVGTSLGLKKVKYDLENLDEVEVEYWDSNKNDPNSISHPFVADILEKDKDHIWIATLDGLNKININTKKNQIFTRKVNDENSISNNVLTSLFEDRTGNIWIGMDGGINKLNRKPNIFKSKKLKTPENINSVTSMVMAKTRKGVWAGSRGGGLNFIPIDDDGNFINEPLHFNFPIKGGRQLFNFVSDIVLDKQNRIWISTDGDGIYRIDIDDIPTKSGTIRKFEHYAVANLLNDEYISSLFCTNVGETWIGYWDEGIARFDEETQTVHHYKTSSNHAYNFTDYPNVHLVETIENGEPFLWIGTRGGGIYKVKYDKESNQLDVVKNYKNVNGTKGELSNNFINAFHVDKKGGLWIGTDNGLNLYDYKTGSFQTFYEAQGLQNGIIQSISEDLQGNIWVSTQQGLSSINTSYNEFKIQNFDSFDGVHDDSFNDDASLSIPSGQVLFGEVNGITYFKPSKFQKDTIVPKVIINDLKLSSQSVSIGENKNGRTILSKNISVSDELELSYKDINVGLEFTGIHLEEPQKIKYAYKLEGFNDEWIYTDASQRIATFTNLPYKDFVFKVKASNRDGVWSEPTNLNLSVKPPFWKTIWAYLLYFIIALGLIALGYHFISLRTRDKHKLQLERLEKDKLREVNKLKLQFFTNISHELRTPLTLIISPLEQLLQEKHDSKTNNLLTRMHSNADRLMKMINQILNIRKNEVELMKLEVRKGNFISFCKEVVYSFEALSEQRNIDLVFRAKMQKIDAWFDHEQMEKVLFNFLSNAIKFTNDGGTVTVAIEKEDKIILTISDTGFGIPKAQLENIFERFYQVEDTPEWSRKSGTGIGLSLTKMIVEKHHGQIKVNSEVGVGTSFIVELPLGNEQYTEDQFLDIDLNKGILNQINESQLSGSTIERLNKQKEQQETKPSVLIVEDNKDIREYLKENLEDKYAVKEAEDGVQGLELAQKTLPSLILADISMPRMDGIEMCLKLK